MKRMLVLGLVIVLGACSAQIQDGKIQDAQFTMATAGHEEPASSSAGLVVPLLLLAIVAAAAASGSDSDSSSSD